MNLTRLLEQDKKLLMKVIAGVVLLAIAFAFYLAKGNTAGSETNLTVIDSGMDQLSQASGSAIEEKRFIMVDVAGAVMNPSVVSLTDGSRVFEAVEKAGGLTKEADTSSTNQAEILADGQKIYIPTKQELAKQYEETGASAFSYQDASARSGLININKADSETLQQLTGIGPATAEKIIDYRTVNGKFKSIDEIKNVSGIGEKTFEKLKNKITV